MEIIESKLKRQIIGINKWITNNCIGTWDWCPRMGKTYAALTAANKLKIDKPVSTIMIITPSIPVKNQWINKIKEIYPNLIDSCQVNTIHFIQENNIIITSTLLILDEIHEYYTEERLKLIAKSTSNFKLGLTGTRKDNKNRYLLCEEIIPVIDIIHEKEALENEWISKFLEYNISVDLTDKEKKDYEIQSELINKFLSKFGRNGLSLAQKCLSGGKDYKGNYYTNKQFCFGWSIHNGWRNNLDLEKEENKIINNQWNPKVIMGYAVALMKAIRERKNILYNASNKLNVATDLIKKFDTLKTICFSQSSDFAENLKDKLNIEIDINTCVSYHSNIETQFLPIGKNNKLIKVGKTRLKKIAIDNFKNGKNRVISTVAALDRGLDISDIRLAIISSSTQNPTQHAQRGARAKTLEIFNKDVVVLIINLYVKNTKDETWLKNKQKHTKNIIYWVDNINDINYTPQDNTTFSLEDLENI